MALVNVVPLAHKFRVPGSLIISSHEIKPLRRTIPTLRLCRRGKSMTLSMNRSLSLSTALSGDDDDGVQRRIGDYHPNLWDDDFIQSLSTPHGAPSYRERADRLIGEVKDMFSSLSVEDGELITPFNDLLQRLLMVDNVERLGIDRYFKNEIKTALNYVYSYWKEGGIGCGRESVVTDLNSTALGLRTLRLHRYPVSSNVVEYFKDEKGQFACSAIPTEEEIRSVFNLFRASLIAFPGEKVMEDAEIFCAMYLKQALQKIPVSSLSRQIEYALEYGWHTNLPRLEARFYIDVFGQDNIYETPYMNTEKLIELAKLEFNIFRSIQQRELKYLSRWWKDYDFPQLTFTRHRHVEYYTFASCIATDPKHSAFRLGFVKMCHLATVLDDIYDTFGTMNELELLTDAIKRWDPSSVGCLPEYMRGVYRALYDSVNEMAREAEKTQGRDTLNYVRRAWEVYMDSYMQEAKWICSGYLPTLEEYLDNAKISSGFRTAILQPILTLGDPLPLHVLQEIDFPSKFNDLASALLRLTGDTRCYKVDRSRGEEASCISCYMKDKTGSTEEDALNHINAMVDNLIKEQNWELLRPDNNVPISTMKHAFDVSRAFHYGYKYRDGYSVANIEMKNLVTRTLLEPVPI